MKNRLVGFRILIYNFVVIVLPFIRHFNVYFHGFWWEVNILLLFFCCCLICINPFSLACLQILLFLLVFQQFNYDVSRSRFFVFILLRVCWASWICILIFCTNLVIFQPLYLWVIFLPIFLSLTIVNLFNHMLDWFILSHRSLKFYLLLFKILFVLQISWFLLINLLRNLEIKTVWRFLKKLKTKLSYDSQFHFRVFI